MPTINSSGTKTSDGTEQTLATIIANNTFELTLNLTNMVNGDVLVVRIKTKVLTGSTVAEIWKAIFTNNQGTLVVVKGIPVTSPFEYVATIELDVGSNKAFEWSIAELE